MANETEEQGPFNRIADVPAGDTEGGPVNPTKDSQEYDESEMVGGRQRFPWEGDPTAGVDLTSASALAAVNEARESGAPLNKKDDSRKTDQGAATPAGTGVSAAPAAGTVDT